MCVRVCVRVGIYILYMLCICIYIYRLSLLTGMFCNFFLCRCSLSSICWRFNGWVFQKMLQHKLHWLACTCLLQKTVLVPNSKIRYPRITWRWREKERERDRIASLSFRESCSPSPYLSIPQLRAPALWRKLQVQNHRPQLVGIFYHGDIVEYRHRYSYSRNLNIKHRM